MRFFSLILGKYCTRVCGTLFGGIKLIELAEKRSRALEVTLGSSTDPNLAHISASFKKPYFKIAFSREVVGP